ncbi:Aste57867_13768 [Aphanomyces stellatus]|uniref:phosphoglycerate kinase n=1 Tax=Aphanomyces stellatus TaxID=120398 RepID=A0A485KZI9_9STRA|nr:hypothetical protein As57867_013718 [Aphanomyces stellatus]VFT90601.1 Aste57867_13768 [Aphanomyces stellatus]
MLPTKSRSSSPTRDTTEKVPGTPSPKRKKMFTVARSVPSTPTLDLSGANDTLFPLGKSSASKEEVKSVLIKQLRRDNNGKIVAHAALGNPDDIEQFDDYLLSTPSGGLKGSRAKNQSLRSLKNQNGLNKQGTFKRQGSRMAKSPSNLSLIGSDANGQSSSSVAGDGRSETPSPPDVTASKAKRQMIEYKKMLRAMPIHERISMEREKKVLLIWETRNREWENFRAKMSKKLKKPEEELVMSKASEYRQQMEEYDLINKATPQEEKHGNEYWSVSLRDEGTRYVPVGNVFSGLFCPVREDKNPMTEMIRRPMDIHRQPSPEKHGGAHHGKFNEALLARKRLLRRNIQQIRPHVIDGGHCDGLKVESQDLFEWATTSSQLHYDQLLQNERTSEEEARRQTAAGVTITLPSDRRQRDEPSPSPEEQVLIGPSLQLVDATTGKPASHEDEIHLSFHAAIATVQTKDLLLRNPGAIAIQYTWAEYGPSHRDFAVDAAGLQPRTFVSQETGVLLPHETKRLQFSFYSSTPGVFLEKWKVIIDPYLAEHNNELLYAAEHTVHLTCAAVDNRAPFQARKRYTTAVERKSTEYMVESLLRQIFTNIEYPVHVVRDMDEEKKRDTFELTNRRLSVHYTPEIYEGMAMLFERAQNLILADKQAKLMQVGGASGRADPTPSTELSPRPPILPMGTPTWDGQLPSLALAAKEADEISKANFKAQTPRNEITDDDDEDDDDENGEDDDDDVSSPRVKKVAFKPLFQLAYEELRHLALFRPHAPSILFADIARNMAFLCGEIPVVAGILALKGAPDIHADLCLRTADFLHQTVDMSVSALFEKETTLAVEHFQRKQVWIQDKLPMATGLFGKAIALVSTNLVLHVDLDVAHCFVLGPSDDAAPPSTPAIPPLVAATPGAPTTTTDGNALPPPPSPVPSEWKWMEGIETFTPAKIAHVAGMIQSLVQGYTAQFAGPAPPSSTTTTIHIVLFSAMSTPKRTKVKKKHAPLLASPNVAIPSMKHVAEKLQVVLDLPVNYVSTIEALHELVGPKPSPSSPVLDESAATTPSPASSVEGEAPLVESAQPTPPTLAFHVHLVESFELLRNPPPPKVDSTPVEEKPKEEKKEKGAKKGAPPAKGGQKDDELKPSTGAAPSQEKRASVAYASPDLRLQAVWSDLFADIVTDALNGWVDVVVSDTFGHEDWHTIAALQPTRQLRLLGPRLLGEFQRVARVIQPHRELTLRHHPRGKLCVVLGGKSYSDKMLLFDGLLEVADEIYVCGAVANAMWRYFHLDKDERKTCAGEVGFEVDVEPAMSWRVMDSLRSKAARYSVKIYLPFDWKVGDAPLETDDPATRPSTAADGAAAVVVEDEDEEDDDDDNDDDDGDDDEDDAPKKHKKEKKKAEPVVVMEPPQVPEPVALQSYDGTVLHMAYTDEDGNVGTEWFCLDDLMPGCLSRFLCRTKSPVDGTSIPTPHVHDWITRTFDTGPLSTQALVARLDPTERLVVAGLPGMVEFAEFQSSARELAALVMRKQTLTNDVLIVGTQTHEWMQRLADTAALATARENAAVVKYLVAGAAHPALVTISSTTDSRDQM